MTSQFLEIFSSGGPDKIEKTGGIPPIERTEKSKKPGEQGQETFREKLRRELERQKKEEEKPPR